MVTPAQSLAGLSLEGGWIVSGPAPAELAPDGGIFAATYVVETSDGRRGFLKALDYARALESSDPSVLLESITTAFNFERELLRKCRDRGLDRVVTAIADGSVRPSETIGGVVQYLIFELHDGDARRQADTSRRFDIAGSLRALHHIATGLAQLHGQGIAHQNLKPTTVWSYGKVSKVADLGQAESRERHLDDLESRLAGDPCYAPPELLYG